MSEEASLPIAEEADLIVARQTGRQLAGEAGFRGSDLTVIATAISEVARNILVYAKRGEIRISVVSQEGRTGICVVAADQGPGIADVEKAMEDGFSSGNSLGLGLPGARRLMDDFSIESALGKGTTVTMRKWTP